MKLNCHDPSGRVEFMTKSKQDNDMVDRTSMVYPKSELNYHDRLKRIWSITKTKQDNDMINSKGVVYDENNTG